VLVVAVDRVLLSALVEVPEVEEASALEADAFGLAVGGDPLASACPEPPIPATVRLPPVSSESVARFTQRSALTPSSFHALRRRSRPAARLLSPNHPFRKTTMPR
jgi:hypothetical protein